MDYNVAGCVNKLLTINRFPILKVLSVLRSQLLTVAAKWPRKSVIAWLNLNISCIKQLIFNSKKNLYWLIPAINKSQFT